MGDVQQRLRVFPATGDAPGIVTLAKREARPSTKHREDHSPQKILNFSCEIFPKFPLYISESSCRAISQSLPDGVHCPSVRRRSHYANWIAGSVADGRLTLALRSLLRRKETRNSTPPGRRMTTQYSITIPELVENRPEEEFPCGFPYGFPLPKHLSRSERRRRASQKAQIYTRAKTRKVRERPHLVRLSAAQDSRS